jgi:hypothetical protein
MKISSIPKSGRKGSVVYLNTRYGKVARQYVRPRNPRTPEQQGHRNNVRAVSSRWRTLTPEQRAAWRMAAANNDFATETGRRVRPTGYNFFVSLNTRRADLDLPQFDLPPAAYSTSLSWGCCHLQPPDGMTSPSFTWTGMACRAPARPFGFAPASTLTAGPMSQK